MRIDSLARPRRGPAAALGLAALLLLFPADPAAAQLRPLDPLAWQVFDSGRSLTLSLGVGLLREQRASLAGTQGRLLELGNVSATWRSGRIALEAGGTALRQFDDQSRFAPPYGGARDSGGTRRRDVGDFRVATNLQLTPLGRPAALALRFGTRLPTTDNQVGLERDRTDFFALLSGRLRRGPLQLAAETGVGVNGTREPEFEQADLLLYALSAEYRLGPLTPSFSVLGHADGFKGWNLRGNEELTELRFGARLGGRHWVEAQLVRGVAEFSPASGLLLRAGTTR